MKIKFILISVLFFLGSIAYSKDTLKFYNSFDFSISYIDFFYFQTKENSRFSQFKTKMYVYSLKYNYKVKNYISVGGYGKLGRYNESISENCYIDSLGSTLGSNLYYGPKYCWHYGVNTKIYLIPLLFRSNIPRFDLYITGNVGLISDFKSEVDHVFAKTDHFIDIASTVGLSLYLFKHIGVFCDYGYSQNKYYKGFNWQFGLNCRF